MLCRITSTTLALQSNGHCRVFRVHNLNRLQDTGKIVTFGFRNLTTCLPLLKASTFDSIECVMRMIAMPNAMAGSTTRTNSESLDNEFGILLARRNVGRMLPVLEPLSRRWLIARWTLESRRAMSTTPLFDACVSPDVNDSKTAGNHPMQPSGEVERFGVDDLSSRSGDF